MQPPSRQWRVAAFAAVAAVLCLAAPGVAVIDPPTYGAIVVQWTPLCNPGPPEVEPGQLPLCPTTSLPIEFPTDLFATTAFWEGNAAYVLGGITEWHSPDAPIETNSISKFTRGMQVGVLPVLEPNQPGGLIVGAGSLPKPAANQALTYDGAAKVAYTFGGSNGGLLSDEIFSYSPVTQSSAVLPCVLPRKFDMMAGAWANGRGYIFGGRYLEGNGDTVAFSLHNSNEIYRFDPASCTLSKNPFDLPTVGGTQGTPAGKRYGMGAVTVDSEIFLFGGTFMDDVGGTTPTEVGGGAYAYNPACPTGAPPYAPCPIAQCSIVKFTPATGMATTMLSSSALCGSVSVVYDGKYIFAFMGNTAYRYNPATPTVAPTYVSALAGAVTFTSAVSTGCSAYIFGGLVRPPPFLPDPAALMGDPYDRAIISNNAVWFGKCRPQAVLAPTYGYSCPNYPIWFDARFSTIGEGDIKEASWNFGDGTVLPMAWWFEHPPDWYNQAAFVSHTYKKEGNFPVTLTIRDFNGLTSTVSTVVPVHDDEVCKMFGGSPHNALPNAFPDTESLDSDSDGIPDIGDNCPGIANNGQTDADGDAMGDACDEIPGDAAGPELPGDAPVDVVRDVDSDGLADAGDNCVRVPNHDQADADEDVMGDVCDADIDGDGISNSGPPGAFLDNCPWYANPDQADVNGDGAGDECAFIAGSGLAPAAAPVGTAPGAAPASAPAWAYVSLVAIVAGVITVGLLTLALRRPGGKR